MSKRKVNVESSVVVSKNGLDSKLQKVKTRKFCENNPSFALFRSINANTTVKEFQDKIEFHKEFIWDKGGEIDAAFKRFFDNNLHKICIKSGP